MVFSVSFDKDLKPLLFDLEVRLLLLVSSLLVVVVPVLIDRHID